MPAGPVGDDIRNHAAIVLRGHHHVPSGGAADVEAMHPGVPRENLDRTKPATYPNGRVMTDDVYSMRFAWLTHGKVPPTGLKPHDNLLNTFPYLGAPTPQKVTA
jgi:hypothetical protein